MNKENMTNILADMKEQSGLTRVELEAILDVEYASSLSDYAVRQHLERWDVNVEDFQFKEEIEYCLQIKRIIEKIGDEFYE